MTAKTQVLFGDTDLNCFVVDDHPLIRVSVIHLLSTRLKGFTYIEAANAEEALQMMSKQNPSLVLLDLSLPKMGGIDALTLILQRHPDTPILILSATDNLHDIKRCMDAGAHAFIHKEEVGDVLIESIVSVLNGNKCFPAALQHTQVEISRHLQQGKHISARQLDVLQHMHLGERNKEIANALAISEATVKVHCRDIFRIFEVNTRYQAVQKALQLGLIAGLH